MASPPPPLGPSPVWSVTVSLRHRGGLEIRAAAENLLPGWGRGGERLSLLLRLRRRLLLSVTSQCGDRPVNPGTPPLGRGCRVVRFLRSRWARLPRVTSPIWRRKKQTTPAPVAASASVPRDRRDQRSRTLTTTRPGFWAMPSTHKSAATLRFVVAILAALAVAVAIFTAFRITGEGGFSNRRAVCDSKPISRWAKFLELMEHPPLNCKYKCMLGASKRGLEWIFSK